MSEYSINIVKKNVDKELFLRLPSKIYDEKHIVQNKTFEKEVLENTSVLCKGVKNFALIVKNKNDEPVGRSVVSLYEDDTAYIGFFECIKDIEVSKLLLAECERIAKEAGKKRLLGPIDISFWIRYRFALTDELSYTGEPANKAYYSEFWEESGFKLSKEYYSYFFDIPDESFDSEKAKNRLKYFKDKGYVFIHPDLQNLEKYLREIYPVLTEGYKNFAGFKMISEEDFIKLYSPLSMILDPDMVFLAYKENELKGFLICLPDYGNLLYKTKTPAVLLNIMNIKANAKRYVLLYMGIDAKCLGLGSALSQLVVDMLKAKKSRAVSALIDNGKATGGYFKEKIKEKRKYVLLEKTIGD